MTSRPKKITWSKMPHELPEDPRWPGIAKRAGVSTLEVIGIVTVLFRYASSNGDRGSIKNFDAETLAAYAGVEQARIEAVLAALADKGFIVGGRLVEWARTQGELVLAPSMSPGAIRTRRWRAKKRADARQLEMMFVFTNPEQVAAKRQAAEPAAAARGSPTASHPRHAVSRKASHLGAGRAKSQIQDCLKKGDGDLGRCAPATGPSPEDVAHIEQTVDETMAQLTGKPLAVVAMQRSGARFDDPAYQAEIRRRKRDHWLDGLTRWACRKFQGADLEEALRVIKVALNAGSRAATPQHERKLLDRMDQLYRPEREASTFQKAAWKQRTRAQSLARASGMNGHAMRKEKRQ
jgi:hypothetical protein